jgi:hypothetical protein
MRSTFESLIVSGITRILDAALLDLLYMIPYAVWGLNIFQGSTSEYNGRNASRLSDCINEYETSVVGRASCRMFRAFSNNPTQMCT